MNTTEPVIQTHANFVSYIQPLLSNKDVLNQQLISLRSSDIIHRLNRQLKDWDAGRWYPNNHESRPLRRRGVVLAKEDFGLLIDDMSPGPDEALIQFKPKWLHQSPNAPPAAKRCRVCALRARRNAEALHNEPPISSLPDFCPLTLVSQSPNALEYATASLANLPAFDNIHLGRDMQIYKLREWLRTTGLFRDLEALQLSQDPDGVLGQIGDKDGMKLRIAMTLRDVSVYILLPHDLDMPIRAGLADLDMKSTMKFESWQRTEEELIEKGWYEGTEEVKQPLDCWINKIEK